MSIRERERELLLATKNTERTCGIKIYDVIEYCRDTLTLCPPVPRNKWDPTTHSPKQSTMLLRQFWHRHAIPYCYPPWIANNSIWHPIRTPLHRRRHHRPGREFDQTDVDSWIDRQPQEERSTRTLPSSLTVIETPGSHRVSAVPPWIGK